MEVYADNAATTVISPAAMQSMIDCMNACYANPSSIHTPGQQAKEALEDARARIAHCLGADASEILFTSGGTEADNQALRQGAYQGARKGKKHLVSSAIEHHAVLHTLEALEREGFEVTLVGVDARGIVDPRDVQAALRPDTALVSIMLANNEIGTIQPVQEIAALCRERGILTHTDAVQAVGHIPLHIHDLGVDLLSFSGHKFHGPRGIGALYVRKGVKIDAFIEGGAQERGKRGGTENLPAIVGMATALEESCAHLDEDSHRITASRDALIEGLLKVPRAHLNGDAARRLPGNVSICFEGFEGESLLLMLDERGIAASSGSACTSGSLDPSHVLLAIGRPHEVAHGSLRLTINAATTEAEVEYLLKEIPPIVAALREISPVWEKIEQETTYVV